MQGEQKQGHALMIGKGLNNSRDKVALGQKR